MGLIRVGHSELVRVNQSVGCTLLDCGALVISNMFRGISGRSRSRGNRHNDIYITLRSTVSEKGCWADRSANLIFLPIVIRSTGLKYDK